MALELFDTARDALRQTGLTPAAQSKISLMMMTAKNVNVLFLGAVEFMPFVGPEQQLLHAQYFQEMESILLLSKVTRWVADPRIYMEAVPIMAPIWNEWRLRYGMPGIRAIDPKGFYQGLALGHALLSKIRIVPVLPPETDAADPYAMALRRIEQDNGRMIQSQITLLRTTAPSLPEEERDVLIEEKQELVSGVFNQFLQWLANS